MIDGREYLIAAELNLREALRLGNDGRGLARLALNYLEKGLILIRAKAKCEECTRQIVSAT